MEAFGLRFRQSGLNHRKQKKHTNRSLEEIIKEEKVSVKDEFIKTQGIKDPNARVWKMKINILGPKHKAPGLPCIRHPNS